MTIKELSFEEIIKISMKRKGYTYQKLADEMGISIGYVSDIIKGNRTNAERLKQLKDILEI